MTDRPLPEPRQECSAIVRIGRQEICRNGFPTNAGCVGIGCKEYGYAVPICCQEWLCARLYPETGKPERPSL